MSPSRNRDDVAMILSCLAQSFTQQKNALVEIGLFHETVWPDRLQQMSRETTSSLCCISTSRVSNTFEGIRTDASPRSNDLCRVDPFGTELVQVLICCVVATREKTLR
jgi:hypothetical protein